MPRLVDDLLRRLQDGGAADLQRARRRRAAALGHRVGVAVHDLDVVDRDAERVARDHGEARVVALTVRRDARAHERGPVGAHLETPPLLVGEWARGHLHVHREPEPELSHVAARPALRLLGPQGRVVRRLEHQVEGALVVAAVVGRSHRSGVRERVLRDEVAAAELCGIGTDLGREQVDRALEGGRRLGAPGAPVGDDRRGVGHDRRRTRRLSSDAT